MPHELRYEALVSATTREQAIEIASEALPAGARIARVHAEDVADREGKDSWLVTLWFAGGRGDDPG